jgi:hypothetical protein
VRDTKGLRRGDVGCVERLTINCFCIRRVDRTGALNCGGGFVLYARDTSIRTKGVPKGLDVRAH